MSLKLYCDDENDKKDMKNARKIQSVWGLDPLVICVQSTTNVSHFDPREKETP